MALHKAEHCMVCGLALVYGEQGEPVECQACGRRESSPITCPAGHYICNACHSETPLAKLPGLARATNGTAPEDILEELLMLPDLPMHGPEHHAMPALALLIACERAGVELPDNFIEEAIRRCMQIPGGACCYHGACGGALALGVAVSLITRATPLTGLARGMAHRATAMALLKCGDDNARCCKRALRGTIVAGRQFFHEELKIEFARAKGLQTCQDITHNSECARSQCAYFNRTGKSTFQ